MALEIVVFIAGLVLLYFGAEGLVAGSSAIALSLGVKPLVVGLTVVAFGTSSPELLVCLTAAIKGNADAVSIGNIIGSNIANIALILGCASMVRPIEVTDQAVRREYPMMLAASFLLVALIVFDGGDPTLTRLDGAVLATGMAAYLGYSYWSAMFSDSGRVDPADPDDIDELDEVDVDPDDASEASMAVEVTKIVVGMAGLALGAYWMVESAVFIARELGVPKVVIGITIVAFGTSLPELATSLVAAFRNESDISVGNVIGSNLFNILLVLGTVALVAPIAVGADVVQVDIWMMLAVAILIFPILQLGETISRFEGGLMLVIYGGYVTYLFMR